MLSVKKKKKTYILEKKKKEEQRDNPEIADFSYLGRRKAVLDFTCPPRE